MKRLFTTWSALAACLLTGNVMAESPYWTPAPTATGTLAAYFDDAPVAPVPGDEHEEVVVSDDAEAVASDCDCAEESSDCCAEAADGCAEASCECGDEAGCGDGCSCSSNGSLCEGWSLCNCCPGDPWTMQKWLCPCEEDVTYAGWIQMGYHSHVTGQSQTFGDLFDFNDVPHQVNLHQLWFYTEKLADTEGCSADWGYRFDMLYGTDAQKTQAFGNSGAPAPEGWDNDWDHGVYGWAIPQLYAEVGMNDWSVKMGHFYTPIGYEVVPATGNFFYSHALTMFNSEPFTHTGVLGTYKGYEDVTVYAGWTLGWDTGFDQFGDGNNFLGGLTWQASDDVAITYLTTVGNFGFRSGDEFGYMHSIVGIADMTENLKYIFQSDYLNTEGSFGDPDTEGEDVGVNQYLLYTLNDCWSLGGRIEWWRSNTSVYNPGEYTSYYELTGGINYKPHANIIIRPEMRYDWSPTDFDDPDYNRGIFGIDFICTY
jgi:hypothetical protein